MPTGVTNGGRARTIGATCSGVTKRGVFSTKMNPRASAPASTAVNASSRLVMPQILTLIVNAWVGRDAPPMSPPARDARGRPAVPMSPPARDARGRPAVPMSPPARDARGQPAVPVSPPARDARGRPAASSAHLLLAQRELPDLRGDVAGSDESFTDQHGVSAGSDDPTYVGASEEAAFADDDGTGRDRRQELQRRLQARLEGGEVAVVDPEDAASGGKGLIELGGRVTLDQGGEAESLRGGEQITQPRRLENRNDQQHRVGARGARLPDLILVDGEVLPEQRNVDRRAHSPQIVEAPLEIFLIGEDRDRVGSVARVRGGHGHRIQAAGEHAARG